jgi:hypothetical protein
VPCVGGNGAVDRLAFPDSCGANRTLGELRELAVRMLTDAQEYQRHVTAIATNAQRVSFDTIAATLAQFFSA